jgi:NADPH-dependent ferric siderophore reductase
MTAALTFKLTGIACPTDAFAMLGEICEHFVEHAAVHRSDDFAVLTSEVGTASIRIDDRRLFIELACPTQTALQMSRNTIAEHLFYFAGEDPLELTWSDTAPVALLPNIHEATVLSSEDITPRMRRVRFSCADVTPFVGSDMHVRLLVPPMGRPPVWPGLRPDGRVAWPVGKDEILVRVYTIRAVDLEKRELSIDFLQHPAPGAKTPGADFARDAQPGQTVALLGPGAGSLPAAQSIFLAGDETALPAIARIAEEVPPGTRLQVIVEVLDAAEEQFLSSSGTLSVRWLHRRDYPEDAKGVLAEEAKMAIANLASDTFVWFAGEKEETRTMRAFLKGRRHDRKNMYVAWYWERHRQ